jgi:hypothetical protein
MATEPLPPTLAEVAERAAAICDPDGTTPGVSELYRQLEDRDEPITAVRDVASEVNGLVSEDEIDPAVRMTAAVIVYLAFRRDEVDAEPADLLRLAARAEFDGQPPPEVSDWLGAQGIPA